MRTKARSRMRSRRRGPIKRLIGKGRRFAKKTVGKLFSRRPAQRQSSRRSTRGGGLQRRGMGVHRHGRLSRGFVKAVNQAVQPLYIRQYLTPLHFYVSSHSVQTMGVLTLFNNPQLSNVVTDMNDGKATESTEKINFESMSCVSTFTNNSNIPVRVIVYPVYARQGIPASLVNCYNVLSTGFADAKDFNSLNNPTQYSYGATPYENPDFVVWYRLGKSRTHYLTGGKSFSVSTVVRPKRLWMQTRNNSSHTVEDPAFWRGYVVIVRPGTVEGSAVAPNTETTATGRTHVGCVQKVTFRARPLDERSSTFSAYTTTLAGTGQISTAQFIDPVPVGGAVTEAQVP